MRVSAFINKHCTDILEQANELKEIIKEFYPADETDSEGEAVVYSLGGTAIKVSNIIGSTLKDYTLIYGESQDVLLRRQEYLNNYIILEGWDAIMAQANEMAEALNIIGIEDVTPFESIGI